jgi:hypothetical protein
MLFSLMSFTADEVDAAVQKLVQVSLQVKMDATGARRTSDTYDELMSTAAGLFLLFPFAPLYILYLADVRLRTLIKTQVEQVTKLQTALIAAARAVTPIEDISALSEARVALSELEGAAGSRTSTFTDTSTLPAYQRFQTQAARFLAGPAQVVKYGNDIVQTPQEARASIPALVLAIKTTQLELQRKATLLAAGYADYESLKLPSRLTRSMLQKARTTLQDHETRLASQTPQERLSTMRNVTLDVLATKAAVATTAAFTPLSGFHNIAGTGSPLGDAAHPANPASLTASVASPYPIAQGTSSSLEVWVDGAVSASETLELNPATTPEFIGTVPEPFEIDVASSPFTYSVTLSGTTYSFTHDLTALVGSGSRLAEEVANVLNPLIASCNIAFSPVFNALKLAGITTLLTDGGMVGGDWTLTFESFGANFINQAVVVGDTILLEAAVSAGLGALEHTAWTVTSVYPLGVNQHRIIAKRTQASFVLPASPHNINFRIGDKKQLQLGPLDVPLAITQDMVIAIAPGATNTGATTVGMLPGLTLSVGRVAASDLMADINSKAKKCKASVSFVPTRTTSFYGYSDPNDPTTLALSYLNRTFRTLTAGASTFTLSVPDADLLGLDVTVGDYVTLRSGVDLGDSFPVSSVDAHTITCTGTPTSGLVQFDVSPDLTALAAINDVVSVTEGPNTLQYVVRAQGLRRTELVLQTALPSFKDPSTGSAIEFRGVLGKTLITLASLDKTTKSAIQLRGPASTLFNPTYPMSSYVFGATPWVKLPILPRALEAGDVLEQYGSDYQLPDSTHTIIDVDRANKGIKLATPVDTQVALSFVDQEPPFAKVRIAKHADFQTLSTALTAWLAREENQSNYFANLNALLNPILLNVNPTYEQTGTAANSVAILAAGLTPAFATSLDADPAVSVDYALAAYTADPIREVDALLRALRERGAARASDLLLEGQFTTFFGIPAEEATYAGKMSSDVRAVTREDLVVRRTTSNAKASQRLMASVPDEDLGSTLGDIDTTPGPDVPVSGASSGMPDFFGSADNTPET